LPLRCQIHAQQLHTDSGNKNHMQSPMKQGASPVRPRSMFANACGKIGSAHPRRPTRCFRSPRSWRDGQAPACNMLKVPTQQGGHRGHPSPQGSPISGELAPIPSPRTRFQPLPLLSPPCASPPCGPTALLTPTGYAQKTSQCANAQISQHRSAMQNKTVNSWSPRQRNARASHQKPGRNQHPGLSP